MNILGPKDISSSALEAVFLSNQLAETKDTNEAAELTKELLRLRAEVFLRLAKIMLMDGKDETCKELHAEWRKLVMLQISMGHEVDLEAYAKYDRMFVRELWGEALLSEE